MGCYEHFRAGLFSRLLLILLLCGFSGKVLAQTNDCGTALNCACKTTNPAVVILPDTLVTNLQAGDLILARFGSLCIGQTTFTPGTTTSLTLWGENILTGDPGIPEGGVITYSLFRPATGQMMTRVRATYADSDSLFSPFSHKVMTMLRVQNSRTSLHGIAVVTDQQHALLSWQASDPVAGFSVEHAKNDATFRAIAFVDGHDSTSTPQPYRFRTDDLEPGHHTFRLKQIDLDGSFSYSDQVEVDVELPDAYTLSPAYPNPFNPQTQLNLTLREAQQVAVEVYDVLGRRVQTLFNGMMEANRQHAIRFEAGNLAGGLYLIQVRGKSFHDVRTVILFQ